MPRSGRQQFIGPAAPGRRGAVLERIVFAIDAALRRWNSVVEFTTDPACILRLRLDRLERPLVLADGTCARAGERFVDLHLWNEQIPPMPKEGASIAWARHMHVCFLRSLQQLVRYLAARPDLDDIAIVRYPVPALLAHKRLRLITGETAALEDGVQIFHVPGHTPGAIALVMNG